MINGVREWNERERTPTIIIGESMTHESFAGDADVNRIVERYQDTGFIPPNTRGKPVFADVTHLQQELTEALNHSNEVINAYSEAVRNAQKKPQQPQAPQPSPSNPPAPQPPAAPPVT